MAVRKTGTPAAPAGALPKPARPPRQTVVEEGEAPAAAKRVVVDMAEIGDFTLGESLDLERVTGIPMTRIVGMNIQDAPMALVAGLVWITQRRADPSVTWEAVLATRFTEIEFRGTPAASPNA